MGLYSFIAQPTEPALNVTLSRLLLGRGLRALGEVKIHKGKELKKPDVLIVLNAVKVILEGKFEGHRNSVEQQCRKRIENGLCDIAIAVEYKKPPYKESSLELTLRKMKLSAKVHWLDWDTDWQEDISLNELVKMIRVAYTRAVSNDVVSKAVEELNETLDQWFDTVSTLGQKHTEVMAEKAKKILELREKTK